KGDVWVYSAPVSPFFPQYTLPQEEIAQMPGYRRPKAEDFAEAKRLLAEAGFPQGLTVKVSHSNAAGINPAYNEGCAILQDQFRRDFADLPNMKIECVVKAGATMSAANVDFTHEMTFWWSYAYEMDPGLQVHLTYACKGGRNYQGNCDQKWMEMWEAQQAQFDPAKRRALLFDLQRYTMKQHWRALMWEAKVANVYNPALRGVEQWLGPSAGIGFNGFFQHLWKAP
ncbi:MAG: hypothetical protein FJ315_02765, partial [SAR202 cluster bacterium]|nr:hypothetical protein [SAR202 cluster bacterium]